MLQNDPFYWGSIRNVVVAFGSLFSDIHFIRQDKTGNPVRTIMVPCEYGPKEKWLIRNVQNPIPGVDDQVEMVLPRMSYQITGFTYDSSRKLTSTGKTVKALISDNTVLQAQFNPVPYNLGFQLNVMTKTVEDALMIIEQIVPFFTPSYTVTINDIPELGIVKDIPVVLTSVQQDDTWEGQFDRRTIIWTLTFTAKAYLYPPVNLQKVILDADTNLYADTTPGTPAVAQTDSHASIQVSATMASMSSGGSLGLTVNVLDTPTEDFTITLSPNVGTATANGTQITYVAPTVSAQQVVTLQVTAADDPRQQASFAITVTP